MVLTASLTTCDARVAAPKAAPTVAPPRPHVFDPAAVALAPSSPTARARAALDADDPAAATQIAQASIGTATQAEAGRLRWLAAVAAERTGDTARESALLDALAGSHHPLARWARLWRATLLEETDPTVAADLASGLTDDWAGQREARSIEAVALARAGRVGEAIPKLRALVDESARPSRCRHARNAAGQAARGAR